MDGVRVCVSKDIVPYNCLYSSGRLLPPSLFPLPGGVQHESAQKGARYTRERSAHYTT